MNPKRRIADPPDKSRLFKEMQINMKLGIEGDSPDPISQYYSINTDNS